MDKWRPEQRRLVYCGAIKPHQRRARHDTDAVRRPRVDVATPTLSGASKKKKKLSGRPTPRELQSNNNWKSILSVSTPVH